MTGVLSRRTVLRALGALPVAFAAGRAGPAAADSADSAPALIAAQRRLAFATAQAEELAAPLSTLSGRLPPALTGVLWRTARPSTTVSATATATGSTAMAWCRPSPSPGPA